MSTELLLAVKVGFAIFSSIALSAAAGFCIVRPPRPGWRDQLVSPVLLQLLAVLALCRGAPHNNPLLYWVYETGGASSLAAFVAALLGCALATGVALAKSRWYGLPFKYLASANSERRIIGILAVLTFLAALEPVIRYWGVPGWGDAIFWDRLSHLIARGELPAGHPYYMPVYQYGTALLYLLFGHHFEVQQLANAVLAPVTLIFFCLAARNIGCRPPMVLALGLLISTHDYLRYTPHVMQIENWYTPLIAAALWASTRSALANSTKSSILAGVAIGLVVSTRAQGAFMCLAMCFAPFAIGHVSNYQRFKTVCLTIFVVAAVLSPWSARNWLVDGRISPMSSQGPAHMVLALQPETFYGIRRDLVSPGFVESWAKKYPDIAERERAMGSYIVTNIVSDPIRFIQAAGWRSLAFFGLLPDGVFASKQGGAVVADWSATGKTWLLRNMSTLVILAAVAVSIAIRYGRTILFLTMTVLGSMAPVLFAGFSEARIHYPVLPILFLIAVIGLGGVRGGADPEPMNEPTSPGLGSGPLWVLAISALVILRWTLFDHGLLQPIQEPNIRVVNEVRLTESLPNTSSTFLSNKTRHPSQHSPAGLSIDAPVRLTIALTNHHLPVKWYSDSVVGFPPQATSPDGPLFFRTYVVDERYQYDWGTYPVVAVSLAGASLDCWPVEDQVVELEGQLVVQGENGISFVKASAARCVGHSRPRKIELTLATAGVGE